MLEKVEVLTAHVERHNAELKQQQMGVNSTLPRTEETTSGDYSEDDLLQQPSERLLDFNSRQQQQQQPPLSVDIEPQILSLNSEAAANRDREIDPEFA